MADFRHFWASATRMNGTAHEYYGVGVKTCKAGSADTDRPVRMHCDDFSGKKLRAGMVV
jgi:hypothetical protein